MPAARGEQLQRRARGQRGFTLIELMVALAISSILVMMVLSVFSRMSSAYRRQQQVSALQGVLSAAQNMLTQEARQAGFQLADGLMLVGNELRRPIRIVNNSAAPDEVYFLSADASVQARVLPDPPAPAPASFSASSISIDVDSSGVNPFVSGELVVVVNTSTVTATVAGQARVIPQFRACLLRTTIVSTPGTLNISQAAPWGDSSNAHCNGVRTAHGTNGQTMVYRFRGRGYRIDSTRATLGVLQQSTSGGLFANDWQDIGIGFADLQVAARMFVESGWSDLDSDGNSQYNWISGNDLTTFTAPGSAPRLTRLTINISARTDRIVDSVVTAATPAFIVTTRPNYNHLGDRASVVLNPAEHIYRYTTSRVDLRNTGAGL